MVVFFCFGLDFAPETGWVSLSSSRGGFGSLISGMSKSPVISDGIDDFSAVDESRLEFSVVDKFCERYPRRPLALARKVTTRFLLLILVEPTSLAALVVPSNAAVVGVRNDVLLRFGFGPEATGVAALSFLLGGMRDRLWRFCPIETIKQTTQF